MRCGVLGKTGELGDIMADYYEVEVTEISDPAITPNPATASNTIRISVKVAEVTKQMPYYYMYAGEIYAQED